MKHSHYVLNEWSDTIVGLVLDCSSKS